MTNLVGSCVSRLLAESVVPTSVGMTLGLADVMPAEASTTDGLTKKLAGR